MGKIDKIDLNLDIEHIKSHEDYKNAWSRIGKLEVNVHFVAMYTDQKEEIKTVIFRQIHHLNSFRMIGDVQHAIRTKWHLKKKR